MGEGYADYKDARVEDLYWFIDANEAIDVASDRGDYNLRPPVSEERLKAMKEGAPSLVTIPRGLLEML